ncbi:MAG: helix-turn-helix domain-containing protein [Firmicutes bacterium]|nr:helix-turn-helix domain-containing protein [Bacillota bacterium]
MNENNIVGKRIAEGRKNKRLSQAQFASLVSMSPQAVGKWERGESLPDIFMLGKIGEVIGNTDICYFIGKQHCHCSCGCCEYCGK